MTLFRILILGITALVVVLVVGNGVVSTYNTRGYFRGQMQVLAQDSASALGLSISHAVAANDRAQIETTIDAMFDSGFYRSIVYVDVHGVPVITRVSSLDMADVPEWFMGFVEFPPVFGQANVVSGWYQHGKVHVIPNNSYLYLELWRVLRAQLSLAVFVLLMGYLFLGIGLRLILRPLLSVVDFSEKIAAGDFSSKIPGSKVIELNRLSASLNSMAERVSHLLLEQIDRANSFHRELMFDAVSGLMTREALENHIKLWLDSAAEKASSAFCILCLENLLEVNRASGREKTDAWIRIFSDRLCKAMSDWEPVWIGRLNGSEFGVFVPGVVREDLDRLIQKLYGAEHMSIENTGLALCMGVAFADRNCTYKELLALADSALHSARSSPPWQIKNLSVEARQLDSNGTEKKLEWLKSALEGGSVSLQLQPAYDVNDELIHKEVLACIKDGQTIVSASAFWPLSERYGYSQLLDKIVLQKLEDHIDPEKHVSLSVNISNASLLDSEFVNWLDKYLERNPLLANLLCFEIDAAQSALAEQFSEVVVAAGGSLAWQGFGFNPESLVHLKKYKLKYVKLDRRLGSPALDNLGTRFYVQSLIQIVHNSDVMILASGVESLVDWQLFKSLGVDGGQGFFLSSPEFL